MSTKAYVEINTHAVYVNIEMFQSHRLWTQTQYRQTILLLLDGNGTFRVQSSINKRLHSNVNTIKNRNVINTGGRQMKPKRLAQDFTELIA